MRIVCLSDTHAQHTKVNVPDGDILIHAGDFTNVGEGSTVNSFNTWLGRLPHKHKIVVAGNHEMRFESRRCLLTNCIYLQDSGCEVEGLKIYGSPFTPTFCNWNFMLPRNSPGLRSKWLAIPHDTDILVTHGPPYGLRDQASPGGSNLGDYDLRVAVEVILPKLHVFGHIHGGYGQIELDGTKYVNASVVNEGYRPVNAPVVIEL